MLLEFKNIHGCYYILIVYYFDDILKIFSLMLNYYLSYILQTYKPIHISHYSTVSRYLLKSKKLISLINDTNII